MADKVKISGPRVDGSYTVTFEVGEYMVESISELIKVPQQTNIKVRVEVEK